MTEMKKNDYIYYRQASDGRLLYGRVREFYDSGRLGVWRLWDGHYIIIDPEDVEGVVEY